MQSWLSCWTNPELKELEPGQQRQIFRENFFKAFHDWRMWTLLVVWFAMAYLTLIFAQKKLSLAPRLVFLALVHGSIGLAGCHILLLIVRRNILATFKKNIRNL